MLILIDNYDSFTYNLYHLLAAQYPLVKVLRNDEKSVEEIQKMKPKGIIISPGPGYPSQAGICNELIVQLGPYIPILGVCLGMQAIAEVYGGGVVQANECMHGKASLVLHQGKGLFKSVKQPLKVARYHSLIMDSSTCPKALTVESVTEDNVIMAIKHIEYPVWGVQFHPESILTEEGSQIIKNFLTELKKREFSRKH